MRKVYRETRERPAAELLWAACLRKSARSKKLTSVDRPASAPECQPIFSILRVSNPAHVVILPYSLCVLSTRLETQPGRVERRHVLYADGMLDLVQDSTILTEQYAFEGELWGFDSRDARRLIELALEFFHQLFGNRGRIQLSEKLE